MRKTMKILVSSLLVLCMLLPMATTAVFAAGSARSTPSVYTGEKNNPEDWTKQDWIDNFAENKTNLTIDSAYELVTFAQASGSLVFTEDTVVTVKTDIVLNEGNASEWLISAVGVFEFPGITGFLGTFDGNGKTISGVYLTHYDESLQDKTKDDGSKVNNGDTFDGFFKILGKEGKTTIKDLALVNSLFTSKNYTSYPATFIGRINGKAEVTLSGLYSDAIVYYSNPNSSGASTNSGVGGIVSLISATPNFPTIKGCVFDGTISSTITGPVGGIVGLVATYNAFEATVEDCVNFGNLYGSSNANVGGIVGHAKILHINRCADYSGMANLVGTVSTTVNGANNYLLANQKLDNGGKFAVVDVNDDGDTKAEANSVISQTNIANTVSALKALGFKFDKYLPNALPAYDDANATVSVYTGFKNKADDWTAADWAANYKAGGEYTIDSAYELMSFAKAGITFKSDATVKLNKDIVINQGGADFWMKGAADVLWKSIDNFQGTFNGQGHTVSGVLYVPDADYMGFFGRVTNAAIQNFGLVNSLFYQNTSGSWYLGAMIGRVSYSNLSLTDCYTDATVYSIGYGGGFIGLSSNKVNTDQKTTIESCVFAGDINGPKINGGFVGLGQASGNSNIALTDCVNMGNVLKGTTTGAFVTSASTVSLKNCINYNPTIAHAVESVSTSGSSTGYTLISDIAGTQKVFNTTTNSTETNNTTVNVANLPKITSTYFADEVAAKEADIAAALAASKSVAAGDIIINIGSATELVTIAALINNGVITGNAAGKTLNLIADIGVNNFWKPIAVFKGTLQGNGHTISGIYITSTASFTGFIAEALAGAKVYNLGMIDSVVKGGEYVGGLIGRAGSNSGSVSGPNVEVSGCYSEAIVYGKNVGGIVAMACRTVSRTEGSQDVPLKVTNCVFAGEVHATNHAGGILGYTGIFKDDNNAHDAEITDCINLGTVATSSTTGGGAVGGIIGYIEAGCITLTRCINVGDAIVPSTTGTNIYDNALVGQMKNNAFSKIVMSNCLIFSDLDQNLFSSQSQKGCTDCIYDIDGEDDIATVYENIADMTVLAEQIIGKSLYSGWSARNGYINESNDQYPLPTPIFENFFAIDVKYVQSTAVKDGTYSVRFTAEIDSLDFSKAGFQVIATVGGVTKEIDVPVATAYKTITAGDGEGYVAVTARDGRYYVALTLTDIPAAEATFVVTPYTVGDAGELVEGAVKTLTFNANGVLVNAQ